MKHTNRLAHETSPYLLQHAHNPVDWFPWGEEALKRAKEENKPILVSIGYSACHWCHVMERESFENEDTAELMNENFINIKIDREERPDLDHIYMDAVQAMSGSGGWPLNVFLTPDKKPFYGGTYFPPEKAYNRPSWKDVLSGVIHAFKEKRNEIESQAETLTAHMEQSNQFGFGGAANIEETFSRDRKDTIYKNLLLSADKVWGGFGRAPKFPQTGSIQYLLRYYHYFRDEEALQQACLSLDKMIYGGIYDQAGGGFARYSTDNEWLVPHFEKMLYDNALLVMVMAEAYQVTGKEVYKRTIEQTLGFIEREMISPEGGFYAALDADSEGVEGKYYVWGKQEVESILGGEAALFCDYYGVTEKGNWEGKNILNVSVEPGTFSSKMGVSEALLLEKIGKAVDKLLAERNKRVTPGLDNKLLIGWNALMNTAFSKAFIATGEERYRQRAISNMEFMLTRMVNGLEIKHIYKEGNIKQWAFLDDYAYFIQALIHLQEITGNAGYLLKAKGLLESVLTGFEEEGTGFLFFTRKDQRDVIIRKKEVYDGATPSGNSVMTGNLLYLSVVFDKKEWKERAVKLAGELGNAIVKYPTSFSNWANLVLLMEMGSKEVVVTGSNFNSIHFDILHNFMPERILQLSSVPHDGFPLLEGKQFLNPHLVYFCENYTCKPPVATLSEFVQQLENY